MTSRQLRDGLAVWGAGSLALFASSMAVWDGRPAAWLWLGFGFGLGSTAIGVGIRLAPGRGA